MLTPALPQPARQRLGPTATGPLTLLLPEDNVDVGEHCFYATSSSPWLRLQVDSDSLRHGWIKLRYRTSLYDEPVRPVVRFVRRDGSSTVYPLNAPIFGAAEWIGPVPADTAEVHISPVARPGPFNFEVEQIKAISSFGIFMRLLRRYPARSLSLLATGTLKNPDVPWQALNVTSLHNYADWVKRGARPLLAHTLDRPRVDWSETPVIRLLIGLDGCSVEALQATVRSLTCQTYPRWELNALLPSGASEKIAVACKAMMRKEPRLWLLNDNSDWSTRARSQEECWCGVIEPGDTLPDHSLAVMVDAIARNPGCAAVYCDEDVVSADGRLHSPLFKPDWSPQFHASSQFIGRLTLIRGDLLVSRDASPIEFLRGEMQQTAAILSTVSADSVTHVRRVLYRRAEPPRRQAFQKRPLVSANPHHRLEWPHVTVVVPTRDRADLLRECARGLRRLTDYPNYDVVIVDNGSTEPAAVLLLERLRNEVKFAVIKSPGAFNFSALCNTGAAHSCSQILVFLNNDISMVHADWLKHMVEWAGRPDVGAVGAKLKFPNGTLQHGGVIMSVSDLCLHKYHYAPDDHGGYLDQLKHPHEVVAVTAACLAVERKKFEAVGGFDAENLPVELNDVDLCLRLAARGWRPIWTPEAELIHHESASRGTPPPDIEYRKERTYFRQRWHDIIRDDPFFHPALAPLSHRVPMPFKPTQILLG
jgi:O-antigen biosynthesis protein